MLLKGTFKSTCLAREHPFAVLIPPLKLEFAWYLFYVQGALVFNDLSKFKSLLKNLYLFLILLYFKF